MPVRRADDTQYTLGTTLSASGDAIKIKGGEYVFMVDGTVGGATISLQLAGPGGTYSNVTSYGTEVKATVLPYVFTPVSLPAGDVKLAVTGGSGVSVSAYLVGLG